MKKVWMMFIVLLLEIGTASAQNISEEAFQNFFKVTQSEVIQEQNNRYQHLQNKADKMNCYKNMLIFGRTLRTTPKCLAIDAKIRVAKQKLFRLCEKNKKSHGCPSTITNNTKKTQLTTDNTIDTQNTLPDYFRKIIKNNSHDPKKGNTILIIDGSGSMWGRVNKKQKILVVREVLNLHLAKFNGQIQLGVMSYGHRRRRDCRDIEMLVPISPIDNKQHAHQIGRLLPRGKTPMTSAIKWAAQVLDFKKQKATIFLVVDGVENCRMDPCAVAAQLNSNAHDLTVHVIGFGLTDEDEAHLTCIAKATGGMYIKANDEKQLNKAVSKVFSTIDRMPVRIVKKQRHWNPFAVESEQPLLSPPSKRIALIVGNNSYTQLGSLTNPVADAKAIAALMRQNGIKVVEHYNLNRSGFLDALERFKKQARGADEAIIYYAGHGMEINGRDVLAPIDMEYDCQTKEYLRAVPLSSLQQAISSVASKVVMLDSCRNRPFPKCKTRGTRTTGGFRGLGRIPTSTGKLLIANATLLGQLTEDGAPGKHSPFAKALLARLKASPHVYFRDLLDQVAEDVRKATNNGQIPEIKAQGGAPRIRLAGRECRHGN